jgi:hypothetical protein
VTAVGPKSAWALGAPGVGGADVEHWDGTAWHHVPVPRGVSVGGLDNAPIAASPGKDAWIFPQRLGHIGLSFYEYNSALHWNGRSWRASSFPRKLIVAFAAAFSGADTWAFGVVDTAHNGVVGYNARYNRRSWRKVVLPGVPIGLSAVSRSDMWAIGPTLKTQNLATDRQVLVAMHWNGRSWRTLALPKIKVAKGEDFSVGGNTVAASSRDVWWPYQVANDARTSTRCPEWPGFRARGPCGPSAKPMPIRATATRESSPSTAPDQAWPTRPGPAGGRHVRRDLSGAGPGGARAGSRCARTARPRRGLPRPPGPAR